MKGVRVHSIITPRGCVFHIYGKSAFQRINSQVNFREEEVKTYLEEEDVVAEISQLGRPKSSDVCDEAARDAVPRAVGLQRGGGNNDSEHGEHPCFQLPNNHSDEPLGAPKAPSQQIMSGRWRDPCESIVR